MVDELPTVYGDVILWELPVQRASEDFVRAGDLVFDVGGNTGGLAIAFSRLVGQGGKVITFECNPKMIRWIKRDLEANKVTNVAVDGRAVYSASGRVLEFFLDDSYYSSSSSLINHGGRGSVRTMTTTLDDVCETLGSFPSFIKIDVEGVEADVLRGSARVLKEGLPAIIFEYSPHAADPAPQLLDLGYSLYDVNSYAPITTEHLAEPFAVNIVAVPPGRGVYKVYEGAAPSGLRGARDILDVELAFDGEGEGRLSAWAGKDSPTCVAMFQAPFAHLAHHSCSSLVLPVGLSAECKVERITGGQIEMTSVRRRHVVYEAR